MKRSLALFLAICTSLCLFVGCGTTGHGEQAGDQDAGDAQATPYPEREIQIVVPYAAGGGTDLIARLVADYVSKEWGAPITVINKTGPVPTAVETLAAKPDGYTMLVLTCGDVGASVAANKEPPFDPEKVTYIARMTKYPIAFTVNAEQPWADFKEFSDWVVKNPSDLTWGSSSLSSCTTFIVADWLDSIGADFAKTTMVPITGSADTAAKVAGGHIVVQVGDIQGARSLTEAGKLKTLCVSPYTHDEYPDIKTAEEQGVTGMSMSNGTSLLMPYGVPEEIVAKWDETLTKLFNDESFLAEVEKINALAGYMNSTDYEAFAQDEIARYQELAEKYGLCK